MKYILISLYFIAIIFLFACSNEPLSPLGEDVKNAIEGNNNTENQEIAESQEVPFEEIIVFPANECIGIPRTNVVCNNELNWKEFYESFTNISRNWPSYDSFGIDFNQKTIITVMMGTFSSPGRYNKITNIVRHSNKYSNKIVVTIFEKFWFSPLCVMLAPNRVVLISKTDLPIEFIYESADTDGDGFSDSEEYDAGTWWQDPDDHP